MEYIIDSSHSEIEFKIKHLMISTVTGRFNTFMATMESNKNDFTDAKIKFDAVVDSITTNITDRDNHLKSTDFFDVENYPLISFESTSITVANGSLYVICGNLTIKDVTKEIIISGTYNGSDVDAYGNTKFGFDLKGKIKRSDFGLTFNIVGEKGGIVISDEVELNISIQMQEYKTKQNEILA